MSLARAVETAAKNSKRKFRRKRVERMVGEVAQLAALIASGVA